MKHLNKILVLGLLLFLFQPNTVNAQLDPNDISWNDLKTHFNNISAYPTMISVYGVKCVPCLFHRNDIRDQVMNACSNPDLRWIIVWFEDPGHPATRANAVSEAALINDSRVTQYWFKEHQSFTPRNDSVADNFGAASWTGCSYAWDMTLLFNMGVSWTAFNPPSPDYCMAKVGGCCNFYSITNFKNAVDNLNVCDSTFVSVPKDLIVENGLNIYPNPSLGAIQIDLNVASLNTVDLSIYNLLGNEIYVEKLTLNDGKLHKQIVLDDSPSGIYYIFLRSDEGTLVHKMILLD